MLIKMEISSIDTSSYIQLTEAQIIMMWIRLQKIFIERQESKKLRELVERLRWEGLRPVEVCPGADQELRRIVL